MRGLTKKIVTGKDGKRHGVWVNPNKKGASEGSGKIGRYDKAGQDILTELYGKDKKKIAGNTYAIKESNGDINVKLYDTNVVTHINGGGIKLNSGGFMTKTTKDRMNTYSDAHVYQKNKEWFVDYEGKTHDFKDGMTLK